MNRFSTPRLAAAALLAVSLIACSKQQHVETQSSSAGAPAPAGGQVVVPAKTDFYGKLDSEISTKKSHSGDKFTLTHTDTFFHKNPALNGAVIEGHLDNVAAAGLAKKPSLTLVFDDVKMADGTTAPVDVKLVSLHSFDAKSHKLRTLGMVVGGAVAGHVAAKTAGKSHGGLMGAAGAYVLSQEMKTDIDVKPGTVLEVHFNSDAVAGTPGSSGGGQ